MKCMDFQEQLSNWIENEVDQGQRIALEAHISECPECRALAEEIRQNEEWLQDVVSRQRLGKDYVEETMSYILTLDSKQEQTGNMALYFWMAVAASVLALVMILNRLPGGGEPYSTQGGGGTITQDDKVSKNAREEKQLSAIEQKLAVTKIQQVEFKEEKLENVINFLSEVSGINMVATEGLIDEEKAINLKFGQGISCLHFLDILRQIYGINWKYKDGIVILFAAGEEFVEEAVQIVYDVAPLLKDWEDIMDTAKYEGNTLDVDILCELIENNTGGDAWEEVEGFSIEGTNTRLIINADENIQNEVMGLLKMLKTRPVYKLNQSDDMVRKQFRGAMSKHELDLSFKEEPLDSVLEFLAGAAGINIVLGQDLIEESIQVNLILKSISLDKMLEIICQLHGLDFKIERIDSSYLLIVDSKDRVAMLEPLELALFDVRWWETNDFDTVSDLVEQNTAGDTWDEWDHVSLHVLPGYLMVRHTKSALNEIQVFLQKLKAPIPIEED
ncbi:anti-sigma factor family protein [Planctomycetota bacterium]